jgi:hypothetical protein
LKKLEKIKAAQAKKDDKKAGGADKSEPKAEKPKK